MQKNTVSQFMRSLIFGIIAPIFTIFYSFACLIAYPFPLRYSHPVVMGWTNTMVWLLKVICRMDYHVTGLENIPHDRTGIVMSKHQSAWETFFLPGRFTLTAIILKRELYWVPFFGWGALSAKLIAINRSNRSSAMEQIIKQGRECLSTGRWILIFPEGTRIAPGKEGHYRIGGARLAVETGAPILPVAHNAGRYWSRRQFIKQAGTIQVVFGPLIESVGRTPEEVLALTKNWIEETVKKIDVDPAKMRNK